jgi:hypothetical protein
VATPLVNGVVGLDGDDRAFLLVGTVPDRGADGGPGQTAHRPPAACCGDPTRGLVKRYAA